MSFYAQLSRYYDEIFPASQADLRFITQRLSGKYRLLDIGCGTGNKTELLATGQRKIIGIDSDPGMIEVAKTTRQSPNVRYWVMDMHNLLNKLCANEFDGITCLGNTLPHLKDREAVRLFCSEAYELLRKNGLLIVQILHYEWIKSANIAQLPLVETPTLTFRRDYVWVGGQMRFRTEITLKPGGEKLENDVVLYPLAPSELVELLAASNFGNIQTFGSLQGDPLLENSPLSLIIAQK